MAAERTVFYNPDQGKLYPGLPLGDFVDTGIPWITSSVLLSSSFGTNQSEKRFDFPRLTRQFTIVNKGSGSINVHFASITSSATAVTRHSQLLGNGDSYTFKVNVPYLFTTLSGSSADATVFINAELINGPYKADGTILTGSGITD